jgi:hypothetical protein
MPQLIWDESDFISCLEVLPEVEEYGISHHFTVKKDGLRLELTVYQLDSDIYITLYRDGIETALISFQITQCSGTRYVNDDRGEFLEFAPSQVFGDRYSRGYLIPVGVRLSVKPHISIQLVANPT